VRLLAMMLTSLLALSACGSPSRVVVLQHPETKQTVQCRVYPWGDVSFKRQIDACVRAYEQPVYRVVGDSGE